MLNRGPPELPGLIATSVWIKGTRFSDGRFLPFALTMPAVTLFSKPKGEPIARTHSPTRSLFGSPRRTTGKPVASIFIKAMSVRLSVPMTLALYSRLSVNRTVISSALSITCEFVRIYPSALTMKPDPSERLSDSLGGGCPCPGFRGANLLKKS